jgi:hypothetical protein
MTHDDRALFSECRHNANHVTDQIHDGVRVTLRWCLCSAITSHVRSNGMIAGGRKRGYLVTPGIPTLGKAVTEQEQRATALLGDVYLEPTGIDKTVADGSRPRIYIGNGLRRCNRSG